MPSGSGTLMEIMKKKKKTAFDDNMEYNMMW
jgi:hypothetical protein